jgi:hypothetical protein
MCNTLVQAVATRLQIFHFYPVGLHLLSAVSKGTIRSPGSTYFKCVKDLQKHFSGTFERHRNNGNGSGKRHLECACYRGPSLRGGFRRLRAFCPFGCLIGWGWGDFGPPGHATWHCSSKARSSKVSDDRCRQSIFTGRDRTRVILESAKG